MVTKIFQLLLLLSPICMGTNIDMDMFDITFFRTGVAVLFIAMLFDSPRREIPKDLKMVMASLLVLVFGNVLVHAFPPTGLHVSMNIFLAVLGFGIIYTHYDETHGVRRYILAAAAINLVFWIIQKKGFDPVWNVHPFTGQEGALIGNQPRLMTYFALITPFLPLLFLFVSFAAGICSRQYAIFVPIAVVLFMRLKSRERYLFVAMLVLSAVVVRQHIYDSLVYRFNLAWAPALRSFFKQPLIGLGIGERPFPELGVIGNGYLQFIFGAGVLAVVWFGYAAKKLRGMVTLENAVPLISLLLIAAIEYPLETPRMWYLIIGIVITTLIKENRKSTSYDDIRS